MSAQQHLPGIYYSAARNVIEASTFAYNTDVISLILKRSRAFARQINWRINEKGVQQRIYITTFVSHVSLNLQHVLKY